MLNMKLFFLSVLAAPLCALFMPVVQADNDALLKKMQAKGLACQRGKSLFSDLSTAEAQLVSMQARLKAIQERISLSPPIPPEVLIQLNPTFASESAQREALIQRKASLVETLSSPDDPRIAQLDSQIKKIDGRIANMINEDGGANDVRDQLRLQERMDEWSLKQDIRAQEILVAELTKKCNELLEQLKNNEQRLEDTVDASLDTTYLDRLDKIVDAIDTKVAEIQKSQDGVANDQTDPNQALILRLLATLERIESRLTLQSEPPQPKRRARLVPHARFR